MIKKSKKQISLDRDLAILNNGLRQAGYKIRITSNDSLLSECCNAPLIEKMSGIICSVCRTIVSKSDSRIKKR